MDKYLQASLQTLFLPLGSAQGGRNILVSESEIQILGGSIACGKGLLPARVAAKTQQRGKTRGPLRA